METDRGPGENNLGRFVPRCDAGCSIPVLYRLASEPISSYFISFLLLFSFAIVPVLLFGMSDGGSCKTVKVKCTLGR